MKLAPGLYLGEGKYQLLQNIGSGSQAEVWEAQQLGLAGFSKKVVLKCMNVSAVGPEHQHLMLREARLAASLHHPHIAEIYDVGADQNILYIAMEHIQGMTLEDLQRAYLKRHQQPIPWKISVHITIDICKALYHAHTQAKQDDVPLQIVHRDLKPSNILLSQEGYVKIIDFGIAKATHPEKKTEGTHAGRVKGTPAYMSPEQIMEETLDARSDLFSLGSILYESLTGEGPFTCEDIFATLVRVVHEHPPSLLDRKGSYPNEIVQVVERMLAKKLDERFQNARAIRRALESTLRCHDIFIEQEDLVAFYQDINQVNEPVEESIAPVDAPVDVASVGKIEPSDTNEQAPPSDKFVLHNEDSLGSVSGLSYDVVHIGDSLLEEDCANNIEEPSYGSLHDNPDLGIDDLLTSAEEKFEIVDLALEKQTERLSLTIDEGRIEEETTKQQTGMLSSEEKNKEAQNSSNLNQNTEKTESKKISPPSELPANELNSIFLLLDLPDDGTDRQTERAAPFPFLPKLNQTIRMEKPDEESEGQKTSPGLSSDNLTPPPPLFSLPKQTESETEAYDSLDTPPPTTMEDDKELLQLATELVQGHPSQTTSSPVLNQVPIQEHTKPSIDNAMLPNHELPKIESETEEHLSLELQTPTEQDTQKSPRLAAIEELDTQPLRSTGRNIFISSPDDNSPEDAFSLHASPTVTLAQESLTEPSFTPISEAPSNEKVPPDDGTESQPSNSTSPDVSGSLSTSPELPGTLEQEPFTATDPSALAVEALSNEPDVTMTHPSTPAILPYEPDFTTTPVPELPLLEDQSTTPMPAIKLNPDINTDLSKTHDMIDLDEMLGFDAGDRTMTSPPPPAAHVGPAIATTKPQNLAESRRTNQSISAIPKGLRATTKEADVSDHLKQEFLDILEKQESPQAASNGQAPTKRPIEPSRTPLPLVSLANASVSTHGADIDDPFGLDENEKTALTIDNDELRAQMGVRKSTKSISKSKKLLKWMIPVAIVLLGLSLVGVVLGLYWK